MRNLGLLFILVVVASQASLAQDSGTVDTNVRVIRYRGLADAQSTSAQVTFFIYATESEAVPLWQESQTVLVNSGSFTALIGSTKTNGLPSDVFGSEQARWLGISVNGIELPRQQLVAVPYAMKSMDADRVGGLTTADLLTKREFQVWLTPLTATRETAAASGPESSIARPARPLRTDPPFTSPFRIEQDGYVYTERNAANLPTLEAVALSTTAGNTAVGLLGRSRAPNGSGVNGITTGVTGAGVRGDATAASGINFGLLGTTQSASGYGAVFNNQAAGKIVGFQSAGTEVAFVDAAGFHGSGASLTNLPAASIVGTIPGSQITGNIAGNAATASVASNALQLGGAPPANYALTTTLTTETSARLAADTSLQTALDSTSTALTALNSTAAKTTQQNSFAANARQTFSAGATNAGFNLLGVNADPTSLLNGDLWLRSDQSRLFARVNGISRALAFTDDPVSGNAATATALAVNGSNCPLGQYSRGVDAGGNAEGCTVDGSTFVNLNPANIAEGTAPINITGHAESATSAATLNGKDENFFAQTAYVDARDLFFAQDLQAQLGSENNARLTAEAGLQANIDALGNTVSTLSATLIRTSQANTYDANARQSFVAGTSMAGLNLAGVTVDPTTLLDGDLWWRSDLGLLRARINGTTKSIVFTDTPVGSAAIANALAANGTNCSVGFFASGVDASGNAEGCTSAGTVTNITAGAGLTGGPITSSGTIAIADGGITNAMLATNTITITAGNAMVGGGTVQLGGEVVLHNGGVTGLNGTANQIEATASIGPITLSLPSDLRFPGRATFFPSSTQFATINIPAGGSPTTPNAGDFWNDSGQLRLGTGTAINSIAISPSTTAFTFIINPLGLSIAAGNCAVDLKSNGSGATFTIPNAAIGDPVVLAVAPDSGTTDLPAGLMLFAYVHAQNNVTLRMCNGSSTNINLGNNPLIKISGRVLKF